MPYISLAGSYSIFTLLSEHNINIFTDIKAVYCKRKLYFDNGQQGKQFCIEIEYYLEVLTLYIKKKNPRYIQGIKNSIKNTQIE